MPADPHDVLRRWMPHLLLMGLLAGVLWVVARVFLPLAEPLLLGSSLALLTTPLLFAPIDRRLARWAPWLGERTRRRLTGIAATLALVAVLALPIVLLIGSAQLTLTIAWGLLRDDPASATELSRILAHHVDRLHRAFPALGLDQAGIPERIVGWIQEFADFGPSFLSFLFAGRDLVAQFALALICLAFFYSEGPRLIRQLLLFTPLDTAQRERLLRRHRQVVFRLLHDTVAVALVKGFVFGGIVYAADHLVGAAALPFVPLVLVAAVLTLLPVVGVTMIWLPLAVLFWSLGRWGEALLLGGMAAAAQVLLSWGGSLLGQCIDERDAWIGFLLFLGLLGGLLAFGLPGLVIGPMAVVLLVTLGSFWLPLYGVGGEDIDTARHCPDPLNDPSVPPAGV